MSHSALILLYAETPLHPGTGSALGAIDLPVARERVTGWPLVPGSSLKGILRDTCRRQHGESDDKPGNLWNVFGGDTKHASDAAGAFSVTDARLLAFPLRSLSGLFAWVTCPAALERFVRDAKVGKVKGDLVAKAEALVKITHAQRNSSRDSVAIVPKDSKESPLISGGKIILEEFDYTAEEHDAVREFGAALDDELGGAEMRLKSHLAVLSDNAFAFSTRFATEVMARIKLNPETKTVEGGALFYQ
ncbi:MAG: type III-B CRISPR module RAMP protein Cmr4, partial [Candidatus Sumerlaeia bacterium]|nr:type III-B CRISPR module RAMP protein Cmr4 [Candidatus Sumerlaeia bacterium]